jgi:hypothetical protein
MDAVSEKEGPGALMPKDLNVQPGAKRIVPRYPFEARFKIQIDRADGVIETVGWARELSEGGWAHSLPHRSAWESP